MFGRVITVVPAPAMIRLHGLAPQGDQRPPGLVQRDGVRLMVRRAPSFPQAGAGA